MVDPNQSNRPEGGGPTGGLRALSVSAIESVSALEQDIETAVAAIETMARSSTSADGHAARALSELADALAGYAGRLRHEWQDFDETLARADRQLASDGGDRNVREAARGERPQQEASPGLRILVTQMAAAGSSRREIEKRLRAEYGVKSARRLVNEILAP